MFASSGINLEGQKYVYLSGNEDVLRAKQGKGGVHIFKTNQVTSLEEVWWGFCPSFWTTLPGFESRPGAFPQCGLRGGRSLYNYRSIKYKALGLGGPKKGKNHEILL